MAEDRPITRYGASNPTAILHQEDRLATRENVAAEASSTLTGNVPGAMTTLFPIKVKIP